MAGIDWNWETFPEYLANVERLPKALNYGMYIGHSALRMYAMGRRGLEEKRHRGRSARDGACGRRGGAGRRARASRPRARRRISRPDGVAGRQPHRRLGGDRPAGRRDGRARCRHLPDRPRHLRRRGAARVSRAAAQGGARQRPADHVRHAGDQAGHRPEPVGLPDSLDRRDRRARRAHVGPGDDPLDQRDLLAEILSAVRLPAGWQELRALPLDEQKARLRDPEVRAPPGRRGSRDEAEGTARLQGGGAATTDPRKPDYANLFPMLDVDWDDPSVAELARRQQQAPGRNRSSICAWRTTTACSCSRSSTSCRTTCSAC